ncbi:hypothetical protein NDU88_003609 [Pleurodeles waltl]|uniref:Uncharacterized protein n=1 Tax=Pleurodeles waltl TaxID=8319 RepID=A0AAV7L6E7_PLEWA|nr:hypothetical protein NDU88_003609 [Pleurodeles waltl]
MWTVEVPHSRGGKSVKDPTPSARKVKDPTPPAMKVKEPTPPAMKGKKPSTPARKAREPAYPAMKGKKPSTPTRKGGCTHRHRVEHGVDEHGEDLQFRFHGSFVLLCDSDGHQRVGIQIEGNTLADETVKSAVAMASVAAATRSKTRVDDETLAGIGATAEGTPMPKAYPTKYSSPLGGMFDAEVKIPGVGVRVIPNKDLRPELVKAAHEGVVSAHAGVAATISILQSHYW